MFSREGTYMLLLLMMLIANNAIDDSSCDSVILYEDKNYQENLQALVATVDRSYFPFTS